MLYFMPLRQARPSLAETAISAIGWGLICPLTVWANYFFWKHLHPHEGFKAVVIFSAGAALVAPLAFWMAKLIGRKSLFSAFAAMFVTLGLSTIAITAVLFALDFWWYFSQWHAPTFSKLWAIQFAFTFASAVYQFLVSGLRLYLPFSLVALIIASMWAARRIMR